ncbi:NmrA family NAD(P)-binding protein, partial [Actinomadura adrarensis]
MAGHRSPEGPAPAALAGGQGRNHEMIFVAGATGNVGSEVVRALATVGAPVRALLRDPEKARL